MWYWKAYNVFGYLTAHKRKLLFHISSTFLAYLSSEVLRILRILTLDTSTKWSRIIDLLNNLKVMKLSMEHTSVSTRYFRRGLVFLWTLCRVMLRMNIKVNEGLVKLCAHRRESRRDCASAIQFLFYFVLNGSSSSRFSRGKA